MKKTRHEDIEREAKTFLESTEPTEKKKPEVTEGLVKEVISLLVDFRDKLPSASHRYHRVLTSIILSLKSYLESHTSSYDYLYRSYTQYSYLIYCTESRNPKRESKVQHDIHQYLLDIYYIWDGILSQHLDYKSRH